ncbi:sporulation peptidase YabG [Clostridium hydrogeniformans]|uniref:sporulation peptidase YabG n=1 Tax=Clostridium hydrogeniformans TaxID=349933 RepID=UPI0004853515|nr:sporulation peptidase YabG [Clostridium hydrogeniformans]
MEIGDIVVRKSYKKDIAFKIIDKKQGDDGKTIYILKGMNLRIIADSPEEDLEVVKEDYNGEKDIIFNRAVKATIQSIMDDRQGKSIEVFTRKRIQKSGKVVPSKELIFGRPGKILHVDGDPTYLENCLKVYKQLNINAEGFAVKEKDQPSRVVELVKEAKPDIVVLTGHDGMIKEARDYMDINNYRNSKYFVEAVTELRNYNSSYDELVIFAGACQSCYENILDAGANFASSPSRVLIHCLDPVFICEKIAYTNIEKVVPIHEILENTITGMKGIGGLQTRGKYREGFPKSPYA